jgi:hypothetical protein
MLAGRLQRVIGDITAQGERLPALVSGRVFAVAVELYAMPPWPKPLATRTKTAAKTAKGVNCMVFDT